MILDNFCCRCNHLPKDRDFPFICSEKNSLSHRLLPQGALKVIVLCQKSLLLTAGQGLAQSHIFCFILKGERGSFIQRQRRGHPLKDCLFFFHHSFCCSSWTIKLLIWALVRASESLQSHWPFLLWQPIIGIFLVEAFGWFDVIASLTVSGPEGFTSQVARTFHPR